MRSVVGLVTIVTAFAVAPAAAGGGWATVGFEPLPDGTGAGGTWSPTIHVKQHGVTPLSGLQPVVVLHRDGDGDGRTFAAVETSEPGVYTADVVFPGEGKWHVTVESGFGGSNVTYGPVEIGAPAGTGGGGRELPAAGLVVALALLGATALAVARRSRVVPAR
jgi:hypothetical protein